MPPCFVRNASLASSAELYSRPSADGSALDTDENMVGLVSQEM